MKKSIVLFGLILAVTQVSRSQVNDGELIMQHEEYTGIMKAYGNKKEN